MLDTGAAPHKFSSHISPTISQEASATNGPTRTTAGQPPARWATLSPVNSTGTAKSSASGGPSSAPGTSITRLIVKNEEPIEPNVIAHECPIITAAIARAGVNPASTINGAITATGTPNPAIPCRKPEKVQESSSARRVGSPVLLKR